MFETEQRRYAQLGADYFWLAGKRWLAWMLAERFSDLKARPNGLILDVGCGPGFAVKELARWGKVVGLDYSVDALRHCRNAVAVSHFLVNGSGEQLPFKARAFTAISALDVFEHLEDDVGAMQECYRTLQPGGILIFSLPAFAWLWGDHDTLYFHKRRYRRREVQDKLDRVGFEVLKLTYAETLFAAPLWLMRRMKQYLPGSKHKDDFVQIPRWLNTLLTRIITSEAGLLRWCDLPFGVNLIGIAQRPR